MREPLRAVAVVVPAHDEERRLGRCLAAVLRAAEHVALPVVVVVALDRCADGSAREARRVLARHRGPWDVVPVEATVPARAGVGHVRNAGVHRALELAGGPDGVWLAHTDADSVVPSTWLSAQVHQADAGADAVVGMIALDDEGHLDPPRRRAVADAHDRLVSSTRRPDGHHGGVWGAHLGVHAETLAAAGGFPSPVHGEDTALVELLEATPGVRVARTEVPVVLTSARTRGRATGGLADLLAGLVPAPVAQEAS